MRKGRTLPGGWIEAIGGKAGPGVQVPEFGRCLGRKRRTERATDREGEADDRGDAGRHYSAERCGQDVRHRLDRRLGGEQLVAVLRIAVLGEEWRLHHQERLLAGGPQCREDCDREQRVGQEQADDGHDGQEDAAGHDGAPADADGKSKNRSQFGDMWRRFRRNKLALAGLVAFLALLSAATGFCAGCELYRLGARLRGISAVRHDHIDPADLPALDGAARAHVEFTHPLCSDCREWERRLASRPEPFVRIDVRERPDLARKYGIAIVPAVFAVTGQGEVTERLA